MDIDDFIDSSKISVADVRHRAILHSSFGCFIVEQIFGRTRVNSAGKTYSPRDVAEDHIQQDLFLLPNLDHYLKNIKESDMNVTPISILQHSELDNKEGIPFDVSLPIHTFMESSFISFPDVRHNVVLHNGFGLSVVKRIFGDYIEHNGIKYSPIEIAKRHITREFGSIPSLFDFLSTMQLQPWMSGTEKKSKRNIKFIPLED